MALGKNYEGQQCALARALELVGERWTLLVMRDALYGVRRYGDFLAHLDIPRAVLSQRLHALVEAGLLTRHRYQEAPPRDEYVLTEAGRALWTPVYTLSQWGERYAADGEPMRLFFHLPCDAPLDMNGACTACGRHTEPQEVEVRPGPGVRFVREDAVSVAMRRPHRLLDPLP
ncbi:ArsR family transcriptional regulator [Sphaerisporangium melleum]|uniref:ArsR family transcriptional regulator n=1 Tax=Sphaerisporangium melleum TaxID=321316 RepID=A0A917RCY7_9ACTN|nr:helix-turn-helix domain-containing protein [Sphaerisporangium melleum]GGK99988.1 ArsR family transcriptional regulator [Sphaerisporangium melleum]GII71268.1 ArsR family transcriptional regulator [Sphaerisporangium melleum]